MKKWKVVITRKGKEKAVIIKARYYSNVYALAEKKYAGFAVKSISRVSSK